MKVKLVLLSLALLLPLSAQGGGEAASIGTALNASWGFKLSLPASGDYIICYSHPRYQPLSQHVSLKFSRHRRPCITLDNVKLRMVNKIKVYRRESNSDIALGIHRLNDRDKELVMDVNLKHIYSFGWSVNADVGVGTDNRYRTKLFGLRFSNYSRSVAFVNSNNTNDASIPGTSGQWRIYPYVGQGQALDDRKHARWQIRSLARPRHAGRFC